MTLALRLAAPDRRIEIPMATSLTPLRPMSSAEIRELRGQYQLSPAEFGSFISARGVEIERWEAGTSRPDATATQLLRVLRSLLHA